MTRRTLVASIAALFVGMGLVSCYQPMPARTVEEKAKISDSITYFRDKRTGLCFATVASMTHSGYTVVSLATVPCEAIPKEWLDR